MALVHGMQLSLCEGQHRAAARRTDPLIMLSRTILGVIAVAQVPLDLNEIMHVHLRGESMAAAAAARRLAAHGDILVEFYAKLRRPLENVEELPEGEPQQGHNHGDCMDKREKFVAVPLQPGVAHG